MNEPTAQPARNVQITVGLTPAEHQALQAAAARDGRSMSAYIRITIMRTLEVSDARAAEQRQPSAS